MDFFSLSGCELVSLAAILAITLAKDFTPEETDTLGNFFSAFGSNLSTIATARASETNNTITKNANCNDFSTNHSNCDNEISNNCTT